MAKTRLMLLMDQIIQTTANAVAGGIADNLIFAEYKRLAALLNPPEGYEPYPPRYVFDRKAIMTATELTLGRPKVQRDVLRTIHVPYPVMWIEWEDSARAELRRRFRQDERLDAIRPYPTRIGFLIECTDETGRKGRITWAWNNKDALAEIPNVSGIICEFDLDGEFPMGWERKYPISLAELWKDNPVQHEALMSIWRTCRHVETPTAQITHQGDETARALLFADVVGEYIVAWACMFLLTANRKAVEYRDVDLSKLNKARKKAKKTPLLNHRTVHLYLNGNEKSMVARSALGYKRKSPRIHNVSSYIGRRGDLHWGVFPYWRGSGQPITKTTYVHG